MRLSWFAQNLAWANELSWVCNIGQPPITKAILSRNNNLLLRTCLFDPIAYAKVVRYLSRIASKIEEF